MGIKLLITDFDGTLVDTFGANLRAYQEAFHSVGKTLTQDRYRECFGFRFDRFMSAMGIFDDIIAQKIREAKKTAYPKYFDCLRLNRSLYELMDSFHQLGGKTAIASTARRENLINAIDYLGIADSFDLIYAADDVKQGKPSPEIYLNTMSHFGLKPQETLIFEDSPVGFEAAKASGAKTIRVTNDWFK